MIPVEQYIAKKEQSLVEVSKMGGAFAMMVRKFSPDNGEEVAPELLALDINQVEAQKADLQAQIAALDILIADLNKLTIKPV